MPEKVRETESNESTQTPYAALLLPRLPYFTPAFECVSLWLAFSKDSHIQKQE